MPSLPLVSVIIPAYNHEKYVQETIASIIAQTYQPIELIMIDDGSKDSTFAKMQEMKVACEKRFVRVEMRTQANAGTCETLNRLFSLAKGDYIYLIASDDTAKPQAIEKEVAFLSEYPDYVLAVGDNEIIDGDSRRIGWDKKRNAVSPQNAYYKTFGAFLQQSRPDVGFCTETFGCYDTLARGNYIPNGYLISARAWRKAPAFTKEAPLEDWFLMLQLSKLGKFKYINEILFSYRWHGSNTIKRTEYIEQITRKTLQYEYRRICQRGNEEWKKLFIKAHQTRKTKCRFGSVFILYKQTEFQSNQYILEVFGKKFVIKQHRL